MSRLERLLNGVEDHTDEDLVDLLPDYFENRRSDLQNLKQFLETNDLEGVAALAHKILGTARSYGLNRLDVIVNELEKYSKTEPDFQELVVIVETLETYLASKNY